MIPNIAEDAVLFVRQGSRVVGRRARTRKPARNIAEAVGQAAFRANLVVVEAVRIPKAVRNTAEAAG